MAIGVSLAERTATVEVPNTCGELVQGIDTEGPFLVSCPIDRFASVTARVSSGGWSSCSPRRPRALAAAQGVLACLRRDELNVQLTIRNPLPVGRGFGTSTADVSGSIAATALALGRWLAPDEMARLAVAVEPSDSTMLPGLALLDHRTARRWELLGHALPLAVVALDFGGTVDTSAYNWWLDLSSWQRRSSDHEKALRLLREGLRVGDPWRVGRAATLSATAHQEVLPKPALNDALALAKRLGAYGVCAAHSGTALGLLVEPNVASRARIEAEHSLPGLVAAWVAAVVDGGLRVCDQTNKADDGRAAATAPTGIR